MSSQESLYIVEEVDFPEESTSRKRKFIMWGLGIMLLIGLLIGVTVLVLAEHPPESEQLGRKEKITLEDILTYTFYTKRFNGTWLSDTEISFHDNVDDIYIFDILTKNKTLLVPKIDHPALENYSNAILSPSRKHILIERNPRKLYRRSYLAEYFIVNVETKTVTQLIHGKEKEFQLALWVPKNERLVFVSNNNIFYVPDVDRLRDYIQITNTGQPGVFYNGITDWVYEEEVFSSNKALWISPNGKYMAFATFNDARTRIIQVPYYGIPGDLAFQYPLEQQIRYPKAGTTNPIVELIVVNLDTIINSTEVQLKKLPIPESLQTSDPILSVVSWATDESLIAFWLNRVQDTANIATYNLKNNTNEIVQSLKNKNGWLDLFTPPIISTDGSKFLLILSQDQGNNTGGFSHITLFDRKQNAKQQVLTQGKFVVTEILKWDEKEEIIYYIANEENDPGIQHLYKVKTKLPTQTECITCTLTLPIYQSDSDNEIDNTNTNGNRNDICLKNNADFSVNNNYFVWTCDGPNVPFSAIYNTKNLTKLFLWEDNLSVKNAVLRKDMPQSKRFKVKINEEFDAQVRLTLPPDMDTTGRTKYPMLVNVYAGPGSNQIEERFTVEWESYLSSSKNFIIAKIDGRGSGLKGDRMMHSIYRRLGTYEIIDQINVTRSIQNQFDYIDTSRTAVWGWSYGGYATGMILAKDKTNVFKCGMSVAPVTDWTLYDSIYTERYMRLPVPSDNLKGYENSKLLNQVEALRNKTYFLVHGVMDDNVHYQQSMMLSRVLERNDIMFRQLSYPDEDHGLAGVRRHLYHNLENFLDECLDIKTKQSS
ncbi:venom dipeptidyl peptidase 4 isoform X2 [Chrysoperla carnea]|uniref:venom dipeptidyl peptidase 4 isoform X2 n=1 Tax=Chrysoperla carnea TaxID=189513 RepID=UPI001D094E80|nr:venom dipeptidyl peptidase 4 isoform X2 [Chrysoperla carnea]